MRNRYPDLGLEYYTCDTGRELEDTYQLIDNLEIYLGKPIKRLRAAENSTQTPFDHYLRIYGGYLPSSQTRWCTKKLKLDPFEAFVGNDPVVSYVGIRGDEDREGYISKKPNIQSIFPFRQNIWSEDVVSKVLANNNAATVTALYHDVAAMGVNERFAEVLNKPTSFSFPQAQKMNLLLDIDTKLFNRLVYTYLQQTAYPLANEPNFPLIDNDEVLVRADIFRLLEESGVGVPAYYNKLNFTVNDKQGQYARSRSGCFFCFYQQQIEWVWLYEQHPDRFAEAMTYEKDGYSWNDEETLEQMIQPARITAIKEEYIKRTNRNAQKSKSPYLLDILGDAEGEGCAACFI